MDKSKFINDLNHTKNTFLLKEINIENNNLTLNYLGNFWVKKSRRFDGS